MVSVRPPTLVAVLVLGIDTSDGVSVALCSDATVLARAGGLDPRRHAETLAPAIAWVLAEAGVGRDALDAVAVGTGPAPFTGLRVGLVTARMLARALGIPAYGVGSLDALARQTLDGQAPADVLAVADARRREVYAGHFRRSADAPEADVEPVGPVVVAAAEAVRADLDAGLAIDGRSLADAVAVGDLALAGQGAHLYAEVLPPTPGTPVAVDAAVVARLGVHRASRGLPTGLEPQYLRRPDVSLPGARKRAS